MSVLQNERGFVLILTMAMLAILSILGVMVLNSSNTDLSITTNTRAKSDAFVTAELAMEYAKQKVIDSPGSIGASFDLTEDNDLDGILPDGMTLVGGAASNQIEYFTAEVPAGMVQMTSTDAFFGNIYRTVNDDGASASGEAPYYRIGIHAEGPRGASARLETLFVNRGGHVF